MKVLAAYRLRPTCFRNQLRGVVRSIVSQPGKAGHPVVWECPHDHAASDNNWPWSVETLRSAIRCAEEAIRDGAI